VVVGILLELWLVAKLLGGHLFAVWVSLGLLVLSIFGWHLKEPQER
jgi:hypothetical protein